MRGKILQVCAIDLTVDKLLRPLIIESNKNGYETHVACTDTGLFKKLEKDIPNLHDIRIDRSIRPISNIRSIVSLYKLIKKESFDIVHVHTPVAALLGRVAAKFARVKHIIYTAHGFYFHENMSKAQYQFYYSIEKYASKLMTDWLLLQSEEDYKLSIEKNFLNKNRIIHLSNGVNLTAKFNPKIVNKTSVNKLRNNLDIKENDIVFSFIGRLVKEKGIIELLESFKEISKVHSNVKLLLIGDLHESERDSITINRIKQLMNQGNIKYLGFRNDIEQLLYVSDIFVLPSYREGLPRSIIEAMAMNNAIIATNIRGCREQVVEGINGYLVKKQSIKDLTEKMKLLAAHPNKVSEMGKQSRKIAVEKFNEEKVLSKQLDLFTKLLANN